MPQLPVISGRGLIAFMRSLGYVEVRRKGSHVRLELRNARGVWRETVPDHRELAKGTLRAILRSIATATEIDMDTLVDQLSQQ